MSTPVIAARVFLDMDAQTSTVNPAPVPSAARVDRASTDDGLVALSYVLAGILFYGGLGWLGWQFLGQMWMLPVGLVLGMGVSMFLVIRRYSPMTASVGTTTEKEQQ